MNYMTPTALLLGSPLTRRLRKALPTLKPPPLLSLIEWADEYRRVASKTSATPGQWKTATQPCAFGPMAAYSEPDTAIVTVMAATQVVKTELDINIALYHVQLDPAAILFVQPTQVKAKDFSKERFQPTVDAMPIVSRLIAKARSRGSENTITHKAFPGGQIDFVGANAPGDLAARPERIVISDEIDKYPHSAGDEGDPLWLAEERASTYRAVGRAKFVRTCSPTDEDTSRIAREYRASDQRKCFVPCPNCGDRQIIGWSRVVWDKDSLGEGLPDSAAIICEACDARWNEADKTRALDALATLPDFGWRQTRPFLCCGERQDPSLWTDKGRAVCTNCGELASYSGHAGFQIPKWLSRRHKLSDVVRRFLEAKNDPELLKIVTNTAFAETWRPRNRETFDDHGLIARREAYGPDDLPTSVLVISGFCDVQGDRLEVQLVGWGHDEEAWPFLYEVIALDPSQPQAWRELDALLMRQFKTRDGRILRIAAFGVDYGGNHGAEVEAFTSARRGRRIFATIGRAGKRPMWPITASQTKNKKPLHVMGVDSAKDAIFGRLRINRTADGPSPGFIHFPASDSFGPEYFEQLTGSERRVTRRRMGQNVTVWERVPGTRNEVLDTFVGALCVRRSLPKRVKRDLEFSTTTSRTEEQADEGEPVKTADPRVSDQIMTPQDRRPNQLPRRPGWLQSRR